MILASMLLVWPAIAEAKAACRDQCDNDAKNCMMACTKKAGPHASSCKPTCAQLTDPCRDMCKKKESKK